MLTSETVGTGGHLLACVNQPPARAGVTNEDAQAAIAKSATRSEDEAKSFILQNESSFRNGREEQRSDN